MTCYSSPQPSPSFEQVPPNSIPDRVQPAAETSVVDTNLLSAIDSLKVGDFQVRWDVAKTIPTLGIAAIPWLIELVHEEDTDWELLWFIARILGNFDHPDAIATLVELLANTNQDVTGMAAMALANQGVVAIEPLAQLLHNTDETIQLLAVQALSQIRHSDVVPSLLQVVQADPASPTLYAAAIEALSHFYHPEVSAALLTALENVNAIVRKAAVIGISLQVEQFNKTELVQQLIPHLHDFNLQVCCQTAAAFGRIGTPEAIEALSSVLQSCHTPLPLKIEIVRALGWIGTPSALECLQPILNATPTSQTDVHTDLLYEAIAVLGRVETCEAKQKATELLLMHLQTLMSSHVAERPNQSPEIDRVYQEIAFSLGNLQQTEAIEPLIHLLALPKTTVRFQTISALKRIGVSAYEQLKQLSTKSNLDAALQQGIEIALQEWQY
jgi:HEAT repeat protein